MWGSGAAWSRCPSQRQSWRGPEIARALEHAEQRLEQRVVHLRGLEVHRLVELIPLLDRPQILDLPITRLFLYVKRIRVRNGSEEADFSSEADRLQDEFMRRANSKVN